MILRKFVDQNLADYGKSNSSNRTRHFKFIGFFVNNKSGHFEQITIALEMIEEVFDKWNWWICWPRPK